MGDRALLLVLVIGIVASAGALPDSPTARRLSGKKDAGSSSVQAPLQDTLAERRALDGAPAGGAAECPCLALDSPKLAGVRAIFAELAADFPVRSLLPTRHSDRTRPSAGPPPSPPASFSRVQSHSYWHHSASCRVWRSTGAGRRRGAVHRCRARTLQGPRSKHARAFSRYPSMASPIGVVRHPAREQLNTQP